MGPASSPAVYPFNIRPLMLSTAKARRGLGVPRGYPRTLPAGSNLTSLIATKFSFVRMREIYVQEVNESLVTIRLSVWELSQKTRGGGGKKYPHPSRARVKGPMSLSFTRLPISALKDDLFSRKNCRKWAPPVRAPLIQHSSVGPSALN